MGDETQYKLCPFCAESILSVAKKCKICGEYLDDDLRRDNQTGSSGLERMLVPVDRPASAIASGYLALFGIVPGFGLPFSIGAIITGCIALKTLKRRPELSGAGRAWFGLICGSLTTLLSLVMLIAMIFASRARH